MNSKNNRINHDFQIAYFLAGACHTADAAYSLLSDLKEDRELALAQTESEGLRAKAKLVRAQHKIASDSEADRLEGEADILEHKNNQKFLEKNILAAKEELEFINLMIERINPLRRYSHLPDHKAHEAAQREEWRLELISRAETFLLTTGTIPSDQFTVMQQHPDFEDSIWPSIVSARRLLSNQDDSLLYHIQSNKKKIQNLLCLSMLPENHGE
jgi:hypothetical protein